jgi:hypothetical protein
VSAGAAPTVATTTQPGSIARAAAAR